MTFFISFEVLMSNKTLALVYPLEVRIAYLIAALTSWAEEDAASIAGNYPFPPIFIGSFFPEGTGKATKLSVPFERYLLWIREPGKRVYKEKPESNSLGVGFVNE